MIALPHQVRVDMRDRDRPTTGPTHLEPLRLVPAAPRLKPELQHIIVAGPGLAQHLAAQRARDFTPAEGEVLLVVNFERGLGNTHGLGDRVIVHHLDQRADELAFLDGDFVRRVADAAAVLWEHHAQSWRASVMRFGECW